MDRAHAFSLRLAELLRKERFAMADFLLALSEFERDRGWVELGYPSLFAYLQRELRLASGPAFYRMTAARLVLAHPELIEPLRDGRLCLSTVAELSKVLTRENLSTVLPRFFGASKQDAKEIAAELSPQAVPARTVVTPIAAPATLAVAPQRTVPAADLASDVAGSTAADLLLLEEATQTPVRPHGVAPTVVEPKTAELSRMHITVSRRLVEKLAAAHDALSHARPGASDDELLEAGLDLLLKDAARRRGQVEKPRKTPPPSSGDAIPAHVKRAVWERDGGRCTFPLESGGVCGSTRKLEFNHIVPKAMGGPPTIENLNLLCRHHNLVEARGAFGDGVMDRYLAPRRFAVGRNAERKTSAEDGDVRRSTTRATSAVTGGRG